MPQLTLSASMNYTAPGGAQVNQEFVAIGSYAASSIGTIDVPSGSSSGATFAAPLGSVSNVIGWAVKNSVGTTILVKTQSNPTGLPMSDGGSLLNAMAKTPSLSPLSALSIQLTAAQTAPGSVDYIIFGD